MVALRSPYNGGEIDVPDELADRYTAAGWVKPTAKKAAGRATSKKSTADDTADGDK